MALDIAFYLVTRDIAIRSGLKDSRYRVADGRFVLDNKDLSRVRFTTDEYINGLSGVERVSEETARRLIAENNYTMGDNEKIATYSDVVETPTAPSENIDEPTDDGGDEQQEQEQQQETEETETVVDNGGEQEQEQE